MTSQKIHPKLLEWQECLSGADRNSIMRQTQRMIWNSATFEVIAESRKMSTPASDGHLPLNALMHNFIDQCYFESCISAIRRLMDDYPITGKRAVYSLRSLLKDMQAHMSVLNRQNILTYQLGSCTEDLTDLLNSQFDRIATGTSSSRSDADCVHPALLEGLIRILDDAHKDIIKYANKYIAHAAAPNDRKLANADSIKLTLAHIREAERTICQVINFISAFLLAGTNYQFLAIPQYDQFEFIDAPLIASEGIPKLRSKWAELESQLGTAPELVPSDVFGS
jgi:hypothetical protein